MSRTLNKVMLIGNVGRDPELKYTPSGIPVTSFRLATSETWKDREGSVQEHTDWHTVVAWRGLAEVIHKLVRKGSRVYIEGRIQTRTFDDKTGNRRHVVEVLADNMLLLDPRKQRESGADGDFDDEIANTLDYDPVDYPDTYSDVAHSRASGDFSF
ncbi:MAG: single-strand DNA-binding protein [Bacteroidota bacterium]|nr:single-strand DNA-binding protein [Bacteroidota bacterium]